MRVIATLRKLLVDRQAATAIEYGLILALVFLAMLGAFSALGSEGTGLWAQVASKTTAAMSGD